MCVEPNKQDTGGDVSVSIKAEIKLKNVGMLLAVPVNYTAHTDWGFHTAH
jgi:hypothetical protein